MRTCDDDRQGAGGRVGRGWPFRSILIAGLVGIAVAGATASAQVDRLETAARQERSATRSSGQAVAAGRDPRNVPPRDKPTGAAPDAADGPSHAVVTNGTLRLGVNPQGHLDLYADGIGEVGLAYLPTGADALIQGCWCEGWGVADTNAGLSGWASVYNGGVSSNIRVSSFDVTANTAESVVEIGGRLRVKHLYRPSARPELYQVDLRVENIGSSTAQVVYRRAMDWDVPPTEFDEFVSVQGSHPALLESTDDGFALVDPLLPLTDLGARGTFKDVGPDDRGSAFDLSLGTLAPGESATLTMFYGAAATEAAALAALEAVDADLYSLGQPSTPDGPTLGTPNTFMFGITDGAVATGPVIVQGRLVVPTGGNPPDGDPAAISGSVGLYLATGTDGARSEDMLIASGTTEPDGTFVLRSAYSSPLVAAAAINDGQINLDLVANVDGFVYHEALIRAFASGAWSNEDGLAPPEVVASPLSPGVNPRFIPGSSGGATTGSTSYAGTCVRYRYPLTSKRAWTTIGELHTPADTEVASFTYGRKADSYVSKALSLDGRSWLLKGMVKVGSEATSSTSAEIIRTTGADKWAREIQTEFVYTKFKVELWCGVFPILVSESFEVVPMAWVGSSRDGANLTYLDDRCREDHFEYLASHGRGYTFSRAANRYGTFSRAATLSFDAATIFVDARSGLSQWVRVSWTFGNKVAAHVLCGTDDLPDRAKRIFAGA